MGCRCEAFLFLKFCVIYRAQSPGRVTCRPLQLPLRPQSNLSSQQLLQVQLLKPPNQFSSAQTLTRVAGRARTFLPSSAHTRTGRRSRQGWGRGLGLTRAILSSMAPLLSGIDDAERAVARRSRHKRQRLRATSAFEFLFVYFTSAFVHAVRAQTNHYCSSSR